MDEELPRKKPCEFTLGSELDRHSLDELEALAATLRAELGRVDRAIAAKRTSGPRPRPSSASGAARPG